MSVFPYHLFVQSAKDMKLAAVLFRRIDEDERCRKRIEDSRANLEVEWVGRGRR